MGLYLPEDFAVSMRKAGQYQASWAKRIAILSFYTAWGNGFENPDLAGIELAARNGYLPMLTWEPWRYHDSADAGKPEDQPDFSLYEILKGRCDAYIRRWAADLAALRNPILFRPMHEMNGNWYPWCGTVNGNRPEAYVETWRYIRSIFRAEGNDRLIWVWSPYAHSVPDEASNEMGLYYPGDGEVDWLGLDGYNWGDSRPWSRWQSFEEIFHKGYDCLVNLAPEKPIMIAETGCAEEGGDKGMWIAEAAENLIGRFPRIKAVVWFNTNKECDWRIDSSPASADAFRNKWHWSH